MKTYRLKIKEKYLRYLEKGDKKYEIRVGYPQIKLISIGDVIDFRGSKFKVTDILIFRNFNELFKNIDSNLIIPDMDMNSAIKVLRKIYPKNKEKLGIYAFRLERLNSDFNLVYASSLVQTDKIKFSKLASDSYTVTDWITKDYPKHFEHFWTKYIPGIFSGEREIIGIYDSCKLVGLVILKKDEKEAKISTLFIDERYRNRGLASKLIKESFKFLNTDKPLISIAEYKVDMFISIIKKYNWKLTQVLNSEYYNGKYKEFVYNGKIL